VRVGDVAATVLSTMATEISIQVPSLMPGRSWDIELTNSEGTSLFKGALQRYPALSCEPRFGLGNAIEISLDNGRDGFYFPAVSRLLHANPALP
jgi:hypothetical protein